MSNSDSDGITPRSELAEPDPDNSVSFGQEQLADYVADEIRRDPDIHVAINGPWGSGKSTVLSKIKEEIDESDSSTISVWYQPWKYSPDQTTLRRTFLEQAYEDVSEHIPEISFDKKEFFFNRLSKEERSVGEIISEFFSVIWEQRKTVFIFSILILSLLLIRLATGFIPNSFAAGLATTAVDFIMLVSITGLILYYRDELVGTVAELATYEVKEPKINQIDIFERKYEELLDVLSENDKNLVLFIDDIDRCNEEEIEEVIIGLSTYLDPDHDETPVAVVAAIDGPKIVRAFDGRTNQPMDLDSPNIIHKTFQFVLPVPSLSRDNVRKMVDVTTNDLNYDLSEADKEHITSLSISHANSNPRIIRSALADAAWMSSYGDEVMTETIFEDGKIINQILDNEPVLFRIALIKMLSQYEDLLSFVTDADLWLNPDRRGSDLNIEWGLFDRHPEFAPNSLDPRPLLALNYPNENIAGVYNFEEIEDAFMARNRSGVSNLTDDFDAATNIDIAYRLLDQDLDSEKRKHKPDFVGAIVDLASNGSSALDTHRSDLFDRCFEIIENDPKVVDDMDKSDYPKLLKFAKLTGSSSLDKIFDKDSPLYSSDSSKFLNKMSKEVKSDSDLVDRYLALERKEIDSGNARQSSQRVEKICDNPVFDSSTEGPPYLLELIDNWPFSDYSEGPAHDLLVENVVDQLHADEYREDAERVFQMVASGNADQVFSNLLFEVGWPRPETQRQKSTE